MLYSGLATTGAPHYSENAYSAAAAGAALDALDEVAKAAESRAAAAAFRRKVRALLTMPWRTTLPLLPPEVQCRVIVSAFQQLVAAKLSSRVVLARRALEAAHLVGGAIPTHQDADAWFRTLALDTPSLGGSVSLDVPASSQAWKEDVAVLVAALPPGLRCSNHIASLLQQALDASSTAPSVLLALFASPRTGGRRTRSRSRTQSRTRSRAVYYAHM
jgi:hypothetical protein